jgi:hypothetical protein
MTVASRRGNGFRLFDRADAKSRGYLNLIAPSNPDRSVGDGVSCSCTKKNSANSPFWTAKRSHYDDVANPQSVCRRPMRLV